MKSISVFASFVTIILIANNLHSQNNTKSILLPIDSLTGKVTYSGMVEVEGMTAKQLYSGAKLWISNSFNWGKSVIDLDDNEGMVIVVKSIFKLKINNNYWGYMNFNMHLYFKEGRYKYVFTNFIQECEPNFKKPLESKSETGWTTPLLYNEKNWNKIKEYTNSIMIELVSSLKEHMAKAQDASKW